MVRQHHGVNNTPARGRPMAASSLTSHHGRPILILRVVAQKLGVTYQRLINVRGKRPGFPAPDGRVGHLSFWYADAMPKIREWWDASTSPQKPPIALLLEGVRARIDELVPAASSPGRGQVQDPAARIEVALMMAGLRSVGYTPLDISAVFNVAADTVTAWITWLEEEVNGASREKEDSDEDAESG